MAWFLYIISIAWIALGSCFILYTQETRAAAKELVTKLPPKVLAIGTFVIGLLLIISASSSHHPAIIRIFGGLSMIKGVFIYLNPEKFFTKTSQWYLESISDQAHRFGGIFIIILGTAVLSWIV